MQELNCYSKSWRNNLSFFSTLYMLPFLDIFADFYELFLSIVLAGEAPWPRTHSGSTNAPNDPI